MNGTRLLRSSAFPAPLGRATSEVDNAALAVRRRALAGAAVELLRRVVLAGDVGSSHAVEIADGFTGLNRPQYHKS
jgi:hypothetical protein